MAAASDIDPKEVEVTIKGLLISRPTVANANLLLRECQDELGIQYFFRKLGFQTFIDYLRSIPHVVLLEPPNSSNPNVYPVASKASKHIDELVSRQRVPTSRKRGVSRRGAYNSRPPPIKRRPIRPPQPVSRPSGLAARPNQHTSSFQSREFRSQAFPSSSSSFFPSGLKNGIEVRELERHLTRNYDQRDLERNGIHNVNDLLSRAENMVERCDTKVYPKLAGNNNSYGSGEVKCIPAGLEDDFDDCDDDFFDYEYYSEEDEKDSEEELSNKAIKLWSKALGEENNGSSSRSPVPRDETPNVTVKKKEELDHNGDLPENEINISNGMIINFRKILSQNPNGIWASQLQNLYSDQFNVSLDLSDLGYPSVISLVSSLPSVFSYCREGTSDWRLFDARYITQDFLDNQKNRKDALLPENERYIPQTIIENIKRLLDNHPDGFRSPDLLSLYEETFNKPLNLEILGFDTLNEFLMILKNDITLKKVFNYYLLLPKHKLVSHEALQPPRPDERLNIPADVLGLPVPEGMMRLGDEIPLQELPPVEMDPDPDRPLLELEVRVAEVISPSFFYMILGEKYQQLENMMDDLHKFYSWEEEKLKIPLPLIAMNLYCAARYGPDQYWHRVKVTRIQRDGKIEIEYIDYGTPGTVESSQLRYLSKEFSHFPAQAICGKLIGVKPLNGTKHGKDACEHFLDLVSGKRLLAYVYQIVERERMQLEMILFDVENPDQEIVINDHLIERGLVSSIHMVQDSSTDDQSSTQTPQPENDSTPVQASGPLVSPANVIPPLENVSSHYLGNSVTSHPASSVNRFRKISATLRQYTISKYVSRDSYIAQSILNKFTTAKFPDHTESLGKHTDENHSPDVIGPVTNGMTNGSVHEGPVTNGMTNGSVHESINPVTNGSVHESISPFTNGSVHESISPVINGLTNGSVHQSSSPVTNGLTNGSVHQSTQDLNDTHSLDVRVILEKMKMKRKSHLFSPLKASLNEGKSEPEPVTGNVVHKTEGSLSQLQNGKTMMKNGESNNNLITDFSNLVIGNKDPESKDCLSKSDDKRKTLEVNSNEAKLVIAEDDTNVRAILLKAKPKKLKNLFGIPSVSK